MLKATINGEKRGSEDAALGRARDEFACGHLSLEAFEARVEQILVGGGPPFDWGDGMGAVHSVSLAEHHKNLYRHLMRARQENDRDGRKDLMFD